MDPFSLNLLLTFAKEVGAPTVISLGLVAILWQQNNLLKEIRDSIQVVLIHLGLMERAKTNAPVQVSTQVHSASDPQSGRGATQPSV